MRPDDNWKETRLLAEDISELLNIPRGVSEDYLTIVENLIIHRFVEAIANDDFQGGDCSIELPYLGSLIISSNDKDQLSISFTPRNAFYRKIKKAYFHRESPPIDQLTSILGQELVTKFEEGSIEDERR